MSSVLSVGRVPAYRRHKPSGQAVVTLCGKDHYLGRWNTKASRSEYDRLIGEWLAAGRMIPQPDDRAVDLANRQREKREQEDRLPKWSPNRLRHTAATEIRRTFGLEAAQVALGHSQADVTQIYAEKDLTLAAEVARKIG